MPKEISKVRNNLNAVAVLLEDRSEDYVYVSCNRMSGIIKILLDGFDHLEARLSALEHPVERLSDEE